MMSEAFLVPLTSKFKPVALGIGCEANEDKASVLDSLSDGFDSV